MLIETLITSFPDLNLGHRFKRQKLFLFHRQHVKSMRLRILKNPH